MLLTVGYRASPAIKIVCRGESGSLGEVRRQTPRLAIKDDLFFRFDAATLS
jgi:hypothetical protein